MISHDSLWKVIMVIRDFAEWTGNRWEIEVGGVMITAQRRSRKLVTKGDRCIKVSDTWIARPDHGWIVIARNFDFQQIVSAELIARPLDYADFEKMSSARRKVHTAFNTCTIDTEGDIEQCEKDFVLIKMFVTTIVENAIDEA